MKRFLLFPLAALLLASHAFAYTETVDGIPWTYTVSGGKAVIRNGSSAAIPGSTSGAITIPSTLGGYPVTSIGSYAFRGCSGLKTLYLPSRFKGKTSGMGIPGNCNVVFYSGVVPPPPVAPPAVSTYKVAFNANGGTLPKGKAMPAQTMTCGKAKKLSANKFTRSGYKFAGWAKSKALAKKGKVAYKNKKSVKNLTTTGKTVKLYAVWKKK